MITTLTSFLSHATCVAHRSNDLNKPPARQPQAAQPHIDNTFSTDRYDGSNYQAPTLPSSVTGGGGPNPQPRRSAYTTAIPSSGRQVEEPKSRRSGELGYRGNYQQQVWALSSLSLSLSLSFSLSLPLFLSLSPPLSLSRDKQLSITLSILVASSSY